jgi:translocation and assembly module TamB
VDTSNAQNPRPEVGVQVARDVRVQVAYNLGLPAPGENPDRTLLVIDWRFLRKWSLSTTIGDRGSSIIDLLWQHRY